MAILFWRKKSNKDAFRHRYIERVLERFPGVTFELDGEYGVKWLGFDRHDSVSVWLESGIKEFTDSPKDGESILDRWVALLEEMVNGDRERLDLECLVPMIRHRSWLEDQQSHTDKSGDQRKMWTEGYNQELVVFYVEKEESIRFASVERVLSSGKTLDELRAVALTNLVRLTSGRTVTGEDGGYVLGANSSLDATMILNPEIFKDARIQIAGEWLVALPDRNTLLVCDSSKPSSVFSTTVSARRLFRGEPYAISSKLFVRSNKRFEVLDTDEQDEEHPIPTLDVIDVHARKKEGGGLLCVVIATPLHADARSIYRLATKLDNYLYYIQSKEYEAEFGKPDPSNTTVEISIRSDSCQEVFDVLDQISEWVAKRGACLEIKRFDPPEKE